MEPYGPVPPPHAANATTNEALMIRVKCDIRIRPEFCVRVDTTCYKAKARSKCRRSLEQGRRDVLNETAIGNGEDLIDRRELLIQRHVVVPFFRWINRPARNRFHFPVA